MSYAIGVL